MSHNQEWIKANPMGALAEMRSWWIRPKTEVDGQGAEKEGRNIGGKCENRQKQEGFSNPNCGKSLPNNSVEVLSDSDSDDSYSSTLSNPYGF